MLILLIAHSKGGFQSAFNTESHKLYGTSGDAYSATAKAGGSGSFAGLGSFHFDQIILLIPFIFCFNLWSNWGATLYGEVRGASDFRKNIYAMGGALLATTAVAAIFLGLFAHTFGWNWYQSANAAYWGGTGPLGVFPYPGMLVAFFTGSSALQLIIVGLLSLWFFGWVGTVFLSSTRVVFAATLFTAILVFSLVKWFQHSVYGVNLRSSEYYMSALYGAAIAIYVASKLYRRSQGMDLGMVYGEIPAE